MTMKVLRRETDGVVYADPADRGFTIRFKNSTATKNLSGVPTTNHATEIIVNDDVDVTLNSVAAVDALSIRIRTSCSKEAMPRLKLLLVSLAGQLDEWSTEDVFLGFEPVTAPLNPIPAP